MKRALRRGLPLAAIGAALIVAGVLLATTPWSGEKAVQEAAAGTVEHRLCDVVLEAPPGVAPQPGQEWLVVLRKVGIEADPSSVDPHPTLELRPEFELQIRGAIRSEVLIDPTTGAVSMEHYGAPTHEATLKGILDTLRVEPFDPATATWPYTDTSQAPAKRVKHGIFEYRPPDPASGLVATEGLYDGIGWYAHALKVANCRSLLHIEKKFHTGGEPEVTVMKEVHPDDEAAFQAFYDEVAVKD